MQMCWVLQLSNVLASKSDSKIRPLSVHPLQGVPNGCEVLVLWSDPRSHMSPPVSKQEIWKHMCIQ